MVFYIINKKNIFQYILLCGISSTTICMHYTKGVPHILYNHFSKSKEKTKTETPQISPVVQPKELTTIVFPKVYVSNTKKEKKINNQESTVLNFVPLSHKIIHTPLYNAIQEHDQSIISTYQKNMSVKQCLKEHKKIILASISISTLVVLCHIYRKKILEGVIDRLKKKWEDRRQEQEKKLIAYENKQEVKEKLKEIADLSPEQFRLITIEDIEKIFLPHNLDLINDLYKNAHQCNRYSFQYAPEGKIRHEAPLRIGKNTYRPIWVLEKHDIYFPILYSKNTLLTIACGAGNYEVCKWLLEHKADPNFRGEKKNSTYIRGDAPLFACLYQNPKYNTYSDFFLENEKIKTYKNDKFDYGIDHEQLKPYLELLLSYKANPDIYSEVQEACNDSIRGDANVIRSDTALVYALARFGPSCDICDRYEPHLKPYIHSTDCNNIALLIHHGASLPCRTNDINYRYIKNLFYFWERILFEGLDPNQKNFSLLSLAINGIGKHPERGLSKTTISFLRLLFSYGHSIKRFLDNEIEKETQLYASLIAANTNSLEIFKQTFNLCLGLMEKEYEFRKSFFENPELLFFEIVKRCKRPDLFIERVGNEMGISLAQQNTIMKDICFYGLFLLDKMLHNKEKDEVIYDTSKILFDFVYWQTKENFKKSNTPLQLKEEDFDTYNQAFSLKRDFSIYNLAKTISYMLENLHKKNLVVFDSNLRDGATKIVLNTLQALYEADDSLYKKTSVLVDFCSNNLQCINLLKKKEGKNILHLLAYGIKNDLLKNILKNSNGSYIPLSHALKQPMRISKFGKETNETPLYIAKEESYVNEMCEQTRNLFLKVDYAQGKKIYNNNPYIAYNTYTDKIHDRSLKKHSQYSHIAYVGHTSLEY